MKAALILVLLCVGLCSADTLYIDAGATGTTCEEDDPCASVAAALTVFGDSTEDLSLMVAPGNYVGADNIGITFPAVEVSLELNGEGAATFDCQNANSTIFTATTELEVTSIDFMNCDMGIWIDSSADLELNTVSFTAINTAIMFSGEDLTLSSVVINGTDTGVMVSNATSLTVSGSTFMSASVMSIDFSSTSTSSVDMESTSFSNTAGVSFMVGDNNEEFEGIVDGCDFTTITTAYAVELQNGAWTLENFNISGCDTAISYMSSSANYTELDMDDIDITSCSNGVSFSAPGSLDINGGSISVTTQGISITSITSLEIDGPISILGATQPIAVSSDETLNAILSDITFNSTGSVVFNVVNCNATISDSVFNMPSDSALDITGGFWGINNVDVNGPINVDEGAAFHLVDATSFDVTDCDIIEAHASNNGGAIYVSNADAAFDTCTFTNCSATYGAGIYATGFAALSVKSSVFENNVASANGAGIDVESSSGNVTEVHVMDLTFNNNQAQNGAAISCCNVESPCNITIGEDSDDTITYSNNTNTATDGQNIACGTEITPFSSAASQPDPDVDSSSSDWLFWLVISLAILLVIGLIVAAGVGVYFYRKRMSYSVVE